MIVKLTNPIKEKTDSYADVCELGKAYFVYAILELDDERDRSYMLNVWGANANHTIYDIPARYFTTLDDSLPANWEEAEYDAYGQRIHIKTFPEWAHDKYFYSKLMDDDLSTLEIFKRYEESYEKAAKDFMRRH